MRLARFPLRYTIPGAILILGAATLAFHAFNERRLLREHLHRHAESELRALAVSAAGELEAAFRQGRAIQAGETMERLAGNRRIDLAALVDNAGRIRYATERALLGLDVVASANLGLGRVLREARERSGAVVDHEASPPGLTGAFPVRMRGVGDGFLPESTGWLLVHYDLTAPTEQLYAELRRNVVPYSLLLSLLCVGLWLFFRRALLARVWRLRSATRAIAQGDYGAEPEIAGGDEIAGLADDLQEMARALRQHTDQLVFLSRHDPLTGLLNRRGLESALESSILRAWQAHGRSLLCQLDIDGFRVINDTQGRAAGDELLQRTSRLLTERLPEQAVLGRLGADEFAVILPLPEGRGVEETARAVDAALHDFRFEWGAELYRVRFNLGAVPLDDATVDAQRALTLADAACHAAKESAHDRIRVWSPGEKAFEARHGQMRWVSRIQSALDQDRFALWAQEILPTVPGADGLHLEILVRLLDPQGAPVAPGRFLPAAERYRLVGQIDQWVVRSTFEFLADHPALLERLEMCSINLSGMSLDDPAIVDAIGRGLECTGGMPADRVCFEITETEAVTHLETAARFIDRLRSLGCRFALDDFGSGVSSFGYLKGLDVDLIKIDGVFVRGIAADPMDRAIVRSINDIAHQTGKLTIAEFVESPEVMQAAREIGVDYLQGHAIGRAVPLERFLASRPSSAVAP